MTWWSDSYVCLCVLGRLHSPLLDSLLGCTYTWAWTEWVLVSFPIYIRKQPATLFAYGILAWACLWKWFGNLKFVQNWLLRCLTKVNRLCLCSKCWLLIAFYAWFKVLVLSLKEWSQDISRTTFSQLKLPDHLGKLGCLLSTCPYHPKWLWEGVSHPLPWNSFTWVLRFAASSYSFRWLCNMFYCIVL